ncbi:ComL DNA uptake lipoprotein [Burkholderiaceae bacterium]
MSRTTISFPSAPPLGQLASRLLLILAALVLIAGCGTKAPEYDPTANWNAERLFQDGKTEMNAANWRIAKERFAAVEARFPFGVYAQQAQINLAYCQWKDKEPELAIATLNRFQQQYPGNPSMDYVLYLKGLVNFTPPSAVFSGLTRQNPGERDVRALRQSFAAFSELIQQFPESRYTPDARKRLGWLVNTMADNELSIARFYYDRYAYVAAINRAQSVITDYQGVPASEAALYIMMMSYEKLGMTDLRNDSERVLLQNFPDTTLISKGFPNKYSAWNPLRLF